MSGLQRRILALSSEKRARRGGGLGMTGIGRRQYLGCLFDRTLEVFQATLDWRAKLVTKCKMWRYTSTACAHNFLDNRSQAQTRDGHKHMSRHVDTGSTKIRAARLKLESNRNNRD
jgi:hypothetical protein